MSQLPERYERQISFEPLGLAGQQRIAESTVLLCGCGALGSTIANSLTRAGVGRLRLVDFDRVDTTNLHRQMLFDETDAERGTPKVLAAAERLRRINSQVRLEPFVDRITPENIQRYLEEVDLVLDGTDNFVTRLLINDTVVRSGVPWIYGGVLGSEGRVKTIIPGVTACLRCMLGERPTSPEGNSDDSYFDIGPTIREVGVIGPIVEMVAALEVAEAMKILSGHSETVSRALTVVDIWRPLLRSVDVPRRTESGDLCSACGEIL